MAETKVQRLRSLGKNLIAPGLRKRKRSETPPEEINPRDEARYTAQEEKAARRMRTTTQITSSDEVRERVTKHGEQRSRL